VPAAIATPEKTRTKPKTIAKPNIFFILIYLLFDLEFLCPFVKG